MLPHASASPFTSVSSQEAQTKQITCPCVCLVCASGMVTCWIWMEKGCWSGTGPGDGGNDDGGWRNTRHTRLTAGAGRHTRVGLSILVIERSAGYKEQPGSIPAVCAGPPVPPRELRVAELCARLTWCHGGWVQRAVPRPCLSHVVAARGLPRDARSGCVRALCLTGSALRQFCLEQPLLAANRQL